MLHPSIMVQRSAESFTFQTLFCPKNFSFSTSKVNDIMRGEPAVIASTRNFEISRRFFSFNILDLGQLKYS